MNISPFLNNTIMLQVSCRIDISVGIDSIRKGSTRHVECVVFSLEGWGVLVLQSDRRIQAQKVA